VKNAATAGFLTYPFIRKPSRSLERSSGREFSGDVGHAWPGFTAAGTVRDFHPVPYYAPDSHESGTTVAIANIKVRQKKITVPEIFY